MEKGMMWRALSWIWLAKKVCAKRVSRSERAMRRRPLLSCEPLEDRLLLSVAAEEQLFVYLLNRARHNPVAYGQEQGLSPTLLANVTPRPALAVNNLLFDSTEFHAGDMATRNYFAHNTPEGLTPDQMVTNAGYTLNSIFAPVGNNVESIAAGTVIDAPAALKLLIVDANTNPPGHRIQLLAMDPFFVAHREVGVGHAFNAASQFENYWSIHTAFTNSSDKFLTGVVFTDANSNGRYDLNEGLAGVTVDIGTASTTTNAAGGWSIPIAGTPSVTITVSGGAFVGTSTSAFTVGADNVEVDFISGNTNGIINFGDGFAGPFNHAPVLSTTAVFKLPSIAEDTANPAATLISTLVGTAITDKDLNAVEGIAVSAVTGNGTWQFSNDSGVNWNSFGTVSTAQALLLPASDMVRFLPNADANGTATFSFRAWDQTTGTVEGSADISVTGMTGGTKAFSSLARTASIVVTAVNDAPVLNPVPTPTLPATREDVRSVSVTVASILGTSVTDVDANAAKGIAVIGVTGGGTWQYSVDGGLTFFNFGVPADTAARLLRGGDRIRFVPALNFNGSSSITYRAWDRTKGAAGGKADITTLGSGGSAAFSTAQQTATITVTPFNDAPVLASGTPFLPAVAVNDTNPGPTGVSVDALAGGFITDVDAAPLKGIAVIGASGTANGQWQFSIDNGSNWTSFGALASTKARLLDATHLVRFLPNAGYTLITAASVLPTLTYRAWDQTSGVAGDIANITVVGGTSAFSARAHVARVRVNDAPSLTPAAATIGTIASNKIFLSTVAALLGNSVVDAGTGARQGIAVSGLTTTSGGRWQFSLDGGLTFLNFGTPTDSAARLLRATDKVRYIPLASNPGSATITFRAWDQTSSSAGKVLDLTLAGVIDPRGAFSSATDTASVSVT